VAIRQLDQRPAHVGRICGARGIVGIDDHERARRRRHPPLDVVQVRQPAVRGIRPVVDRSRADLGEHGGVERIGRRRHEDFVARLRQRGQRQLDAFGRARGDQHAVGRDRHAAARQLAGHRFTGGVDADRGLVAVVAVAHRALDRLDHVRRRLEAEGDGVADIEVADLASRGFDLFRLDDDVPDGVAEAVDAARDRDRGGRAHGRIVSGKKVQAVDPQIVQFLREIAGF
jgi:hypothetical protein